MILSDPLMILINALILLLAFSPILLLLYIAIKLGKLVKQNKQLLEVKRKNQTEN